MSLNLTSVYQAMVRQFSAGTDSTRFANDFIDAVNDSLDELVLSANLTTTDLPHVTTTSSSITNLEPYHASILKSGVRYHLMMYGQVPAASGEGFADRALADWNMKRGEFMVLKSQADQAVVDSDGTPTGDIIGLGCKTQ